MSIWLPQASHCTTRISLFSRKASLRNLSIAASSDSIIRRIPASRVLPYHYSHYHFPTSYVQSSFAGSSRTYATPSPPNEVSQTPTKVESSSSSSNVPANPVKPLGTRIWEKVKHEAAHYWHGSKLLVSEIRISMRLVSQLLKGKTLTRREKRQVRLVSAGINLSTAYPTNLSCSCEEQQQISYG